jgi:hypothetical protein
MNFISFFFVGGSQHNGVFSILAAITLQLTVTSHLTGQLTTAKLYTQDMNIPLLRWQK